MANQQQSKKEIIDKIWHDNRFLWFLPGLAVGFLIGLPLDVVEEPTAWFIDGIWPEMLGILFTVVTIDRLNERRERKREERELQARLVREVGSQVPGVANRAVEILREHGWLKSEKSVLKGADLRGANLEGANLAEANLSQTILDRANLRHTNLFAANMRLANLSDTVINGADLRSADLRNATLINANLENANLYFTAFGGANLENANLSHALISEATSFNDKTVLPDAKVSYPDVENQPIDDLYKYAMYHHHTHNYTTSSYFRRGITNMRKYTDPDHPDFWQPEWAKAQQAADKPE